MGLTDTRGPSGRLSIVKLPEVTRPKPVASPPAINLAPLRGLVFRDRSLSRKSTCGRDIKTHALARLAVPTYDRQASSSGPDRSFRLCIARLATLSILSN